MENLNMTTIGVVILILMLVLDKVIALLKTRGIDLQDVTRKVHEIHTWMKKEDEEGVKLMYRRKSDSDTLKNIHDEVTRSDDD